MKLNYCAAAAGIAAAALGVLMGVWVLAAINAGFAVLNLRRYYAS